MKFKTKTIHIPLCENCEKEINPSDPYCKFKEGFYCGDCAFKLGKITKDKYIKQFLYFISPDLINDVIIKDDKVMVI